MLVAPSAGLKAIQLYFLDVKTSFIQTLFAQQAKPMCTCVHACSDATCSASKLVLSSWFLNCSAQADLHWLSCMHSHQSLEPANHLDNKTIYETIMTSLSQVAPF